MHEQRVTYVTDVQGAELVGRQPSAYRDYSGWAYPTIRDGGVIGYRVRLDHPEMEEQPDGSRKPKAKELTAPGARGHLYFLTSMTPEQREDVSFPIALFESPKKAIAGNRLALFDNSTGKPRWVSVGLAGVNGYTGRIGKTNNASGARVDVWGQISDFDLINWKGRLVKIVFDSNAKTNTHVKYARYGLALLLIARGAIVEFIDVPPTPEGGERGVDDWLGTDGPGPVLDAMNHGRFFDLSLDNVLGIIRELPETNVPLSALRDALNATASILIGTSDRVTRQLVRDGCVSELKARGVASPAKLVDAAIGDQEDEKVEASGGMFTDPEPWPEPVDGATLLDEMVAILQRYVFADIYAYWAVALWALFSHAFESVYVYPILSITAPTKRAGKTTLMQVLSAFVRRKFSVVSMTPAVLYRICEQYQPSILMDEADRFLNDNPELCGLINSSHTPGTVVPRCVGDDHEVQWFTTRMPLAISGIGRRAETIADRAITVVMSRQSPSERRDHLRLDRLEDLKPIQAKARRWVLDNAAVLRMNDDPRIPDELINDRARDNWRTLIMIAEAAGGPWPDRAREAALALAGNEDESQSISEQLIADLFVLFTDRELGYQDAARIESHRIADYLHSLDSRPWSEWGRAQKPITPVGIARLLRDHRTAKGKPLKPDHWREGGQDSKTIRGWNRADLADCFDRFCRGNRLGTSAQPLKDSNLQENDSAQLDKPVPSQLPLNSLQINNCADVPSQHTPLGGSVGVETARAQIQERSW